MTTTNAISTIDQARHELCLLIVRACDEGASSFKVRVNFRDSEPANACVYGHIANQWHKVTQTIQDPQLTAAVRDELVRLAALPHTDKLSVQWTEKGDHVEADIKLHREDLDAHRDGKLESYLFGVLFYERGASRKTRRKPIRRGPSQQVARF